MRKTIAVLKEYFQQYFHSKLYLLTVIFLAVSIALNYYFDFEDSYIDAYVGKKIYTLWFFLFHSIPYYLTCLLIVRFTKYKHFIKDPIFWAVSIFGFIVQAVNRSFFYHNEMVRGLPIDILYFVYQVLGDTSSIVIVAVPLFIYYWIYERKTMNGFYGLTNRISDLKPYLIMLGIVLLLIIPASFLPDFQSNYPQYQDARGTQAANYYEVSEWVIVSVYEFFYGLSFIAVELFFRGFLILVFIRYLGPFAVLPMVTTYVFLHFGKPLGETISSAFGGYILGVLVYQTKNIWGGVAIHMGVALLMELVAYLQKIFW